MLTPGSPTTLCGEIQRVDMVLWEEKRPNTARMGLRKPKEMTCLAGNARKKKGKRQKEQFQAKLLNSSWEDAPPLESWAIKNVLLFSLPEGTG